MEGDPTFEDLIQAVDTVLRAGEIPALSESGPISELAKYRMLTSRVDVDAEVHFTCRAAHIEPGGRIPGEWLEEEPGRYIAHTSLRVQRVRDLLHGLHSTVRQFADLPPDDWLEEVKTSAFEFAQQRIDAFTVGAVSAFDASLQVGNHVLRLGIPERDVSWKVFRQKVTDLPEVEAAYSEFRELIGSVSRLRNRLVHSGISRELSPISWFHELVLAASKTSSSDEAWRRKLSWIEEGFDGARYEVESFLREELARLEAGCFGALNSMSAEYLDTVAGYGGLRTYTLSDYRLGKRRMAELGRWFDE